MKWQTVSYWLSTQCQFDEIALAIEIKLKGLSVMNLSIDISLHCLQHFKRIGPLPVAFKFLVEVEHGVYLPSHSLRTNLFDEVRCYFG